VRYALIEAPCRPVKTEFPLLYNKLLGMRSLLQFNFSRQCRKKTISLAVCTLFKGLGNYVGKKVQVKGIVLESKGAEKNSQSAPISSDG
jgi:hypothetical protein